MESACPLIDLINGLMARPTVIGTKTTCQNQLGNAVRRAACEKGFATRVKQTNTNQATMYHRTRRRTTSISINSNAPITKTLGIASRTARPQDFPFGAKPQGTGWYRQKER